MCRCCLTLLNQQLASNCPAHTSLQLAFGARSTLIVCWQQATAEFVSRVPCPVQVWLGKPEALLFREGCQLLACLMFILLYVWRYAAVLQPW